MILFSCCILVKAHDKEGHDADIEYVLFANQNYKDTHPEYASKIQAIEDAVYLCVDQFNGNGEKELENLKNEKIPDLPDSISEINFTGNFAHRRFTHRGWNVAYDKKAHWPERQEILINTVNKELFSESKKLLSWFPWLSEKIYGEDNSKKQCESLCVLLYYVHIIGDHIEADKKEDLAYVDPLTSLNDRDNPGIIPDLISCCEVLFQSQSSTYTYKTFMQELKKLENKSDKLTSSVGGVNTDEEFDLYHQYAEDLLDLLSKYVSTMLKKEDFFKSTFA